MTTVRRGQVRPGITLLTLDRPDRLNAMSRELVADLHDALDEIAADRECRVVVLTGAGRGFCSGLDLKETGDAAGESVVGEGDGGPPAGMRVQQHIATLIPQLRRLPQPVIAAVNGPATGGGLALALACDVRVAAESARFNVAFIRVGLSGCDIGVSYLLPRLVGASRAFELMLTGRMPQDAGWKRHDQRGRAGLGVRASARGAGTLRRSERGDRGGATSRPAASRPPSTSRTAPSCWRATPATSSRR